MVVDELRTVFEIDENLGVIIRAVAGGHLGEIRMTALEIRVDSLPCDFVHKIASFFIVRTVFGHLATFFAKLL